jgi:hypothetical protein
MPTFRPRKRGVSYSEALAEAYVSAPETEIILDTLEFRHPSFGSQIPRVVNDHIALMATLEAGAPIHGGMLVEFLPVAFRFTRPEESDTSSAPEIMIEVDNVARVLIPYIDLARESTSPIEVTWRPYLVSDLSGPHMDPPLTLTISTISANMTSVQARAGFADLANRRFPRNEYTSKRYRGLSVR